MNTEPTKGQQSELGVLIDMPLGNFIDKVKSENLGYILSLIGLLERVYFDDLKKSADEATLKAKGLTESDSERNKLILLVKNIYNKMQLIEEKVTYLKREAERRKIDLTN